MTNSEQKFGTGRIDIPDIQPKAEETSEVLNKGQNPNPKIEEVPTKPHPIIRPESPSENLETVDSSLNPENKNFFKKMSEGGRAIAGQVFEAAGRVSGKARESLSKIPEKAAEGVYNLPGVARFLGKMEITYNQFWADKHEEKALGLKDKMDNFDLKTKTLEGAQKDLEEKIEGFKKSGFPVGSLALGLRDIERQKEEIAKKRDVIQSKFESRDNNRKLYIGERDRVADTLINRYDEKLKPFEKTIEDLKISRDQLDLASTISEIKNVQQEEKYKILEQDIKKTEDALRASGKREWTIGRDKTLNLVRAEIINGRKEITTRRENIAKERSELNRKIAEADEKANPLRDKRGEFIRIKNGRPIDINVKQRKREENVSFEEEIKDNSREESFGEKPEEIPSGTFEDGVEEIEDLEIKEVLPLPVLISIWNSHLKRSSKVDNFQSKLINVKDFVKAQQMFGEVDLSFKDFRKILEDYYKIKEIPIEKNVFGKDFGSFEDKSKIFKNAFVQWVSGGSEMFKEPTRVKGFSEDGKFAFVEGTKTGIPVSELESLG
jgi:hypothetical protein